MKSNEIICEIVDWEDLDAEAFPGGLRIGYLWNAREGDIAPTSLQVLPSPPACENRLVSRLEDCKKRRFSA